MVAVFTDELVSDLQHFLSEYNSVVMLGDFNIHINDPSDMDAQVFMDTMEAFGLKQHIKRPTHRHRNILDLIFTQINDSLDGKCVTRPCISDHNPVLLNVELSIAQTTQKTRMARKISSVTEEDLVQAFNPDNVQRNNGQTKLVKSLKCELSCVLDKVAPLKEIKIKDVRKTPWFDSDILVHKKCVRNLEEKWHKYKLESIWLEKKNNEEST